MSTTNIKHAWGTVQGHMALYLNIQADVDRIIRLVQDNPEFFDAYIGESCIKVAADKLEELIQQEKRANGLD